MTTFGLRDTSAAEAAQPARARRRARRTFMGSEILIVGGSALVSLTAHAFGGWVRGEGGAPGGELGREFLHHLRLLSGKIALFRAIFADSIQLHSSGIVRQQLPIVGAH